MGMTGKWNDYIFVVIFVYHLATREWPMGGTLQTVMDVLLGICMILILFKHYIIYKKKAHGQGESAARGALPKKNRQATKRKRR